MADMPTYAGLPACSCLVAWLPAYDRRLAALGIKLRYVQLIGGYSKSAGTHSGGGSFDAVVYVTGKRTLRQAYDRAVYEARQMGAPATWYRPPGWDGSADNRHVHGVLNGCPHTTAGYQVRAVIAGRNGLANNGPDTGPRNIPLRTWRQGVEMYKPKTEDPFMALSSKQQAELLANSRRGVALVKAWSPGGKLRDWARRVEARQRDQDARLKAIETALKGGGPK